MSPLGFELDEIYLFATRRIQIQDIEQQQVTFNLKEAKFFNKYFISRVTFLPLFNIGLYVGSCLI